MSCTAPQPYLVPFSGGTPRRLMYDYDAGRYGAVGRVVYLPCGNCISCRREKRQDLTCLQLLESMCHEWSWFLTLTYEDSYLPANNSLCKEHIRAFCESLRKAAVYDSLTFRYFGCGEYGDKFDRPHYHLSIFGLTPDFLGIDLKLADSARDALLNRGCFVPSRLLVHDVNGNPYWQSKVISDRWIFGQHKLYLANRLTFQYVAGYVVKKLTGDRRRDFISSGRLPSYCFQSRPSIGYPWFVSHRDKLFQIYRDRKGDRQVDGTSIDVPGMSWRVPRIMRKWIVRDGDFVRDSHVIEIAMRDMESKPDRFELHRKDLAERQRVLRHEQSQIMKGKLT